MVLYNSNSSLLVNTTAFNESSYGFYLTNSNSSRMINLMALDESTYGVYLLNSYSDQLINVSVFNQTSFGVYLSSSNSNQLINITAAYSANTSGIRLDSSYFNLIANSTTFDNNNQGLRIQGGGSNNLTNDSAFSNGLHGFYITAGSVNDAFSLNTAFNNSQGFTADNSSSGISFSRDSAFNNTNNGFQFLDSSGITINSTNSSGNMASGYLISNISSTAFNMTVSEKNFQGYTVNTGSSGAAFSGDSAANNIKNGFQILNSNGVSLNLTTSSGNGASGYLLTNVSNGAFNGTVSRNNLNGYTLNTNSYGVSFFGDNAQGNTNNGFQLTDTGQTSLMRTISASNGPYCYYLDNASSANFSNTVADHCASGYFLTANSYGDNFSQDTIANNTLCGLTIHNSGSIILSNPHFYNNDRDLLVNRSGGTISYVLSQAIFDEPAGDMNDYSNISINDTISAPSRAYSISWSGSPASLPNGCHALAGLTTGEKFLAISNITGHPALNSFLWGWLDTESTPYNKSQFDLAFYNGSSWSRIPIQELDTMGDTLSAPGMGSAGVLGILECNDIISTVKLDQTAQQPSFGGVVQFNITIMNEGDTTLEPVSLTDVLPDGLTYQNAYPIAGVSGQTLNWSDVGPLTADTFTVIYVNATVDPGLVDSSNPIVNVTNYANLTASDPIGYHLTANSSANATAYYANFTALTSNLTANIASGGGIVQYEIDVTNTGAVNLTVFVNDTLDPILSYSSDNGSGTVIGQNIDWTLYDIPPQTTKTILLNASVNSQPVDCQDTENNLSVIGVPPNGDNISQSTTLIVPVCLANVSVMKIDQSSSQPSPGGVVTFNITVTNTGNVTLDPVTVQDSLPDGLTYLASDPVADISASPLTWYDVGPIGAGASAVIFVNATVGYGVVDAANPIANLTNYVNVTGVPPNGDNVFSEDYANATVYYANISILKVDITPRPPSPGGLVQWNITVSNPGQVQLDHVAVADDLPLGFQYSNAVPSPIVNGLALDWADVGLIPAGGSVQIYLNTSVDADAANGTYTNSVSAIGVPPNGFNVTDSDAAMVGIDAPGVDIFKSVSNPNPLTNTNFTYRLTVTNTGSINLSTIITDTLPMNLSYHSSNYTPLSVSGQVITWSIPDLPVGGIFLIDYNVSANASGLYTNDATATGTPPNGNNIIGNDSVSVVVGSPISSSPHGEVKKLQISAQSSCMGNGQVLVNTSVSSSGDHIANAHVVFGYQAEFGAGTTDSDGYAWVIVPCGTTMVVEASGLSGYESTDYVQVPKFDCSICPSASSCPSGQVLNPTNSHCVQCISDNDCLYSQVCSSDVCVAINCTTGQVADHQCQTPLNQTNVASQCTSDLQCGETQRCMAGSCSNLTGQCGYASNHTWVAYACDSGQGCAHCPGNQSCAGKQCVPETESCSLTTTTVGSPVSCTCSPAESCSIGVIAPNGTEIIVPTTDGQGQFTPPSAGVYQLVNGLTTVTAVSAAPAAPPPTSSSSTAAATQGGNGSDAWLLVILAVLIVGAAIAWYRRGRKKK